MKKSHCENVDDTAFGNAPRESSYCDDPSTATRANAAQLHEHEPAQHQFMQSASTGFVQPSLNRDNMDSAACVLGFAVVKKTPRHFGGIYAQEDDAKRVAKNLGAGYEVFYGYYRFNTEDFLY